MSRTTVSDEVDSLCTSNRYQLKKTTCVAVLSSTSSSQTLQQQDEIISRSNFRNGHAKCSLVGHLATQTSWLVLCIALNHSRVMTTWLIWLTFTSLDKNDTCLWKPTALLCCFPVTNAALEDP